jgi:hypothetical protein
MDDLASLQVQAFNFTESLGIWCWRSCSRVVWRWQSSARLPTSMPERQRW